MKFNVGVVVVCAGKGKRLGRIDKPILKIKGKPLFYHSTETFRKIKAIKQIVIVLRKRHFKAAKKLFKDTRVTLAKGGKRRRDSVYKGLLSLDPGINYVLIHDGARPFVSKRIITRLLSKLRAYPSVICGIQSQDTVKLIDKGFVRDTLKRKNAFLTQTPQGFSKKLILEAYRRVGNTDLLDEAQAVERIGKGVKIVEGDSTNIKITYPQDLQFAKAILK